MLLPTTASTVWILAIVALVCLGSWANMLKLAGKWRFEYFYLDFVVGLLLSAGAAAFLLGTARPQDLTFQDNMLLAGYRKMAWAVGSGVVFDLGTLLLVAAMAISGMSVAFPLALGVALLLGTIWDITSGAQPSWVPMAGGMVLLLAGIVSVALAYVWRLQEQKQAVQAPLRPDPRAKSARAKQPGGALAVILAIAGGIVLSLFPLALSQGTFGENGLAPYSAVLLLSVGALLSAPIFVLFFITFPVSGDSAGGYLSGKAKQHLLGLAGGVLLGGGMLSGLLSAGAPAGLQLSPLPQYALSHGAFLLAAAWGLLAWREFQGSGDRVRMLVTGMLVLCLGGVGLVAFALSQGK
jgi:glucose uptake protein